MIGFVGSLSAPRFPRPGRSRTISSGSPSAPVTSVLPSGEIRIRRAVYASVRSRGRSAATTATRFPIAGRHTSSDRSMSCTTSNEPSGDSTAFSAASADAIVTRAGILSATTTPSDRSGTRPAPSVLNAAASILVSTPPGSAKRRGGSSPLSSQIASVPATPVSSPASPLAVSNLPSRNRPDLSSRYSSARHQAPCTSSL